MESELVKKAVSAFQHSIALQVGIAKHPPFLNKPIQDSLAMEAALRAIGVLQ